MSGKPYKNTIKFHAGSNKQDCVVAMPA